MTKKVALVTGVGPGTGSAMFQINVMALLHLVRRTAPSMMEAGHGVMKRVTA
jgi:short-subunit dehydrogenase